MGKKPKFAAEYLDRLIEEATVDAYDESEQATGFFNMIEENFALPFSTIVLRPGAGSDGRQGRYCPP